MDDKYEIVQFQINNSVLDVHVLCNEGTAWLTQKQMSLLLGVSVDSVSLHAKRITKEAKLDGLVVEESSITASDGKKYRTKLYNMGMVLAIADRVKSQNALLLRDFLNEYFRNLGKANNTGPIVVFENGNVSLPVRVSPEENTVWLDKDGLVSLFGTTRQNVEYHIANIYGQGELEEGATCKEVLQVQDEAERKVSRLVKLYDLDLIISLGYRVNTKNGIAFRVWASSVLKEYLLKGYAISESRTLVTDENYINLIHKVDSMDLRLSKLENEGGARNNRVFFDGAFFDARSFLKGIFARANKEIILVDPYADILALDYLKEKREGVSVKLLVSARSKLTQGDIEAFHVQYGPLGVMVNATFHDRFIILDEKELYHVGASLNYAGRKTFGVNKIEDEEYLSSLLDRIKA